MGILYGLIFFLLPLIFFPKTSEVFEFNKMVAVYLATTLVVALWTTRMVSEKKIIFRRTILDIPLLVFLGSQTISTIISIDPITSIFGYYSRFHGGLLSSFAYALLYWAYVSNMDRVKTVKAVRLLLLSAAIVSIYGTLEHFGYSPSCLFITGELNVDCWVQDVAARVFATLGQPNWMAAFLAAVSPLAWRETLISKDKRQSSFWGLLSLLFFAALLFTKSRSGLLGFVAALSTFWLMALWKRKAPSKAGDSLKKFLVLNFALLAVALAFGTPFTATQPVSSGPALEQGGTESGEIRKIVWRGALDISRAYPLFGSGTETFAYAYYAFRPLAHNLVSEWEFLYNKAHNEYLNFLATTGLVGLFSYLALIGASILIFLKSKNFFGIALLAGYFSILVSNFFGFSVVVIGLLTFLYPALAASFGKEEEKEKYKLNLPILGATLVLLFLIARYWQADYLYSQGKLFRSEGELAQAQEKVSGAVSLIPYMAPYHDELARIYSEAALAIAEEKGASEATALVQLAADEINAAQELSPRNINVKRSAANIYSDLATILPGYFNLSLRTLEELSILAPTDPKVFYTLGLTYAKIGRIEKAVETLEKAIELKPDYEKAIAALKLLTEDKE